MDFYKIKQRSTKQDTIDVYVDFKIVRSKDIMIRAKDFYAIWDEETQLWSTDEYDVQRIIDNDLYQKQKELQATTDSKINLKLLSDFSSNAWMAYKTYISKLSNNSHQLDSKITFANSIVKKNNYVSRRLDYDLADEGTPCPAYSKLIETLYVEEERDKLEWAIGSIIAGDSKDIQKFIVLYGDAGTGKSTILNIIQKLFKGYYTTFEAKSITANSNSFAMEVFKQDPLIAIQHDGDLSKIEDNTTLNSIVSHEEMTMNEKYKPRYTVKLSCMLFMGTNKPVKISDAKSGIIRRLIDVTPSGNKLAVTEYNKAIGQIDFELGAIARRCLTKYQELGRNYYNSYRPMAMIMNTDVFFNFIDEYHDVFKEQDGVSLTQAYTMYKEYCAEALIEYRLPKFRFRDELKNYFRECDDQKKVNGVRLRNYYSGFISERFKTAYESKEVSMVLKQQSSILDLCLENQPAQYGTNDETPLHKWSKVKTTLQDIDTRKLHFVKLDPQHIVIDFDLKDNGVKSLELNMEAASKLPPTYTELSKSGKGIHLHYKYIGDVDQLNKLYSDDVEIKVFKGDACLRRKLTLCNDLQIATIKDGLPKKGDKMINFKEVEDEQVIRKLIHKNIKKEIHPGTKPSIDFIHKILEDAYEKGISYDVSNLRQAITIFALKSTNHSEYCLNLVGDMKFKSESDTEAIGTNVEGNTNELVFFDVEVFPNMYIVCWKLEGKDRIVSKMINPTAKQIEPLLKYNLVGFNNRRYDNHILYAIYLGYTTTQIYEISRKIVNNESGTFGQAYNLSYTDIYDFSSVKQGLKKFQIELGLKHQELGVPWDEPLAENLWLKAADYCANDVSTTEEVFHSRKQDFVARLILSELSGLTPNDTTQSHAAKIIFGDDQNHKDHFVYPDLSKEFPGYKYEAGKSTYKGEVVGEGGYVYAEPGMYRDVSIFDVTSMHPTTIIHLNLFGKYTQRVKELLDARVAIKNKNYDLAKTMLNGVLEKYLINVEDSVELSYALKIVINIIYGLTAAKFENKFTDSRNKDNVVAKRGGLFMIDLKEAVKREGHIVAHIKTDSIKIPNCTPRIAEFIIEFGKKYGYNFEYEGIYNKFCLVNESVYIAKTSDDKWKPKGAQFAHPFVYKTLFTKEEVTIEDMAETKAVSTAMYLDINTNPDNPPNYQFIGKVGRFVPVVNGWTLVREKEGKYYAVAGTKGHKWISAEIMHTGIYDLDYSYHQKLALAARKAIDKFGDYDWFVLDKDRENIGLNDLPCGSFKYNTCHDCPNYINETPTDCRLGYDVLPF